MNGGALMLYFTMAMAKTRAEPPFKSSGGRSINVDFCHTHLSLKTTTAATVTDRQSDLA